MLKRLVNYILFTLTCVVAMEASPSRDEYRAITESSAGGTIVARTDGGSHWSLRAVPEPGYKFSRWTDGNTDNPRHYTIESLEVTLTAQFERAPFSKSVYNGEYGTVTAVQVDGCLNQWTLTVTPYSGYAFKEWADDGSTTNPRTVILESENYNVQSYEAIFKENWCWTKTVNLDVDNSGSYDGSGTVNSVRCNCEYYLTATPASGSIFVGWHDGNTDNPRVVELEDQAIDSYTFKARFKLEESMTCDFNTHTGDAGHGTVSGSQVSGCEWKLTATPASGWEFTRWSDGSTTNPRNVTLDHLKSYITYKAIFTYVACKPYRAVVDYNSPRGGTVSATRSDCNWTLTATPDANYEFAGWTNGSFENPMIITIDDPSKTSLTYGAKFRPYSCDYNTAVSEGQGTITAARKTCDPCVYTITAVPNAGWKFTEWSDDHSTTNPRDVTISLSVDPVTKVSHDSYTAIFTDTYCENVRDIHTDCDGGTIVATRRNECEWVLTAVPANSNYEFICWTDGGTGNPRIVDYSRESTESVSWSAKFAPCRYSTELYGVLENGTITATQDPSIGCRWTIEATPGAGWKFDHWEDGVKTNPRQLDTDGEPFTKSAVFYGTWSEDFHSVINNPARGGTVTATKCNYTWTLTATPDTENGYQFVAWEDGSVTNPRTFDIQPSETVQNYFALFMVPDGRIDAWAYNGLEVATNTTDILDGRNTATAHIYANDELLVNNAAVTKKEGDWGRWFISFDPSVLDGHAGKELKVRVFDLCDQLSCAIDTIVPVVVTNSTMLSALAVPDGADVQVVRGLLSIDKNAILGELDIYGDAQVSLPSGKSLTVNHIYMRGNGLMSTFPKFSVNGKVTNKNSNTIYYDYTLDYSAYYPLALPYTVACSSIRTKTGNAPLYEVSWYNGDDRALNVSGWTVYDDTEDGAEITAGQGYSIFAVPESWKGNMQRTVVLRFPMVANLTASTGEPEKSVSVALYNYEGVTNESNKNWNLIGNPYLTDYSPSNNENLMEVGYYIPAPSGSGYIDTGEKLRYLTWSVDGNRTYIQRRITETTISAFRPYFVQAKVAGDLVFSRERRASSPNRQWMAEDYDDEPERIEYELGVTLSSEAISDRTGLLYGELFTQDYEMNADLVKMFGSNQPMSFYSIGANDQPRAFNALPLAEAGQPVPLGFRNAPHGTMQVAFDTAHYDASMFEAVWLIDYESSEITNLLDEPYAFHNTQSSSDTRFALFASPAAKPHTPTGTDIIDRDAQGIEVYDMLGRRVDTDCADLPQGVYVVVENGKPRKEVVK